MRFVADHMLGRLARWLRLLGYDVIYPDAGKSDVDIIQIAKSEERILLTRDKKLAENASNAVLLKNMDVCGQIEELKEKLGIKVSLELTRCSECNSVIERVDTGFARGKVPERVLLRFSEFWYCRKCRKLYWYGSHVENMRVRIEDENSA
ncbi:MAG: DUF5615 family PIN-like protein [Thermoplasmata archaeon]